MSILDVFTGGNNTSQTNTEETETDKYAVVLNAGPEETPKAGNAFNYVLELNQSGYEAVIYLDGKAVEWPGHYAENPDHPYNHDWNNIVENGLVAGVCGYCANALEQKNACQTAGVDLLSGDDEHAPAIAKLADENYEILML